MFNIFMNPGDHADLCTPNYQNQNIFTHALSLNQGLSPPFFFSFLNQVIHYLSAVEV